MAVNDVTNVVEKIMAYADDTYIMIICEKDSLQKDKRTSIGSQLSCIQIFANTNRVLK